MPEYEGIPDDVRDLMPEGLHDIGGGKSVIEIDPRLVEICQEAHEYCAEVVAKTAGLAENLKRNGSNFAETMASILMLGKNLTPVGGEGASITLAYLMAASAFPEEIEKLRE